ncbi:hypothetical protein PMIN03_009696 [Paraphaeosphaeria minitans]
MAKNRTTRRSTKKSDASPEKDSPASSANQDPRPSSAGPSSSYRMSALSLAHAVEVFEAPASAEREVSQHSVEPPPPNRITERPTSVPSPPHLEPSRSTRMIEPPASPPPPQPQPHPHPSRDGSAANASLTPTPPSPPLQTKPSPSIHVTEHDDPPSKQPRPTRATATPDAQAHPPQPAAKRTTLVQKDSIIALVYALKQETYHLFEAKKAEMRALAASKKNLQALVASKKKLQCESLPAPSTPSETTTPPLPTCEPGIHGNTAKSGLDDEGHPTHHPTNQAHPNTHLPLPLPHHNRIKNPTIPPNTPSSPNLQADANGESSTSTPTPTSPTFHVDTAASSQSSSSSSSPGSSVAQTDRNDEEEEEEEEDDTGPWRYTVRCPRISTHGNGAVGVLGASVMFALFD